MPRWFKVTGAIENTHCMPGLGQGFAARFVFRSSARPGATGFGYEIVSFAHGCLRYITASLHIRSGPGLRF